uniref:Inhibitory synaptic factor family member 2B n=1 Tax=Podarcis muralis TaxID=64176 RepID=A0A670JHF7_PODMU|nr:protein INSYN2B [Podarcis muralis]XP_028573333.1 protein INSYN2B [Podarcis muralis]XP_028573334.1 protein INSYN2B [Podarcis muralis]
MGRKETHYLPTLNCDSMAQQGIKVRPVLLKRNSLDSVDFRRQPHHRRSKSQQVRFKDDGTDNPPVAESELETGAAQDLCELGKTQTSLVSGSPFLTPSHKGLQNIAIQTSPSLRKHFPVFKKKKITTSKSLTEMPNESEYSIQVNGNLSEQDIISSGLSYLSITQHLDDGPRAANRLFQRVPKAQSNGPVHLVSDKITIVEKATVSTQAPEYTHLGSAQDNFSIYGPHTQMEISSPVHSSTAVRQSNENCSVHKGSEKSLPCLNSNWNEASADHSSYEEKNYTELLAFKDDTSTKETILSSPQLHHSSLCCSLQEHQQPIQQKTDSDHKTLTNDIQTTSFTNNNASPSVPSCQTVTENVSTNTEVPQYDNCLEGFHINAYLPGAEIKPHNKEIKEINQIHLAHSELCALQDRLQSVEESLQSNQEKIKVLLNVIQDMEKARALNEGRNFYRTGQDLNNCSTCQNTACIIYSVEYDFRQQEGRFHQVLKTLDEVEECPPVVALQRQPSDHPVTEKQEIRRKSKKKKCFWWI